MKASEKNTVVGVLGQWASGKSAAAEMLVRHLGGADAVEFITDRKLFISQAVQHILALGESGVVSSTEPDGRRRLQGEHATVWLAAGEDLKTADLNTVLCDVDPSVLGEWLNRARVELAHQIRERSAGGRPIVIEAGYGVIPPDHTLADLFLRLEEGGVEPQQVRWILVVASYDKRVERNRKRRDRVPVAEFARHAADGGDLAPDQQRRLEERGAVIRRVANDHDDIDRFRADVIAAFEEM